MPIPVTAPQLLAEMDRIGIDQTLVYHAHAVDGHPAHGNERLMQEIEGHLRLHPCWVVLPTSGEMLPPAELVAEMKTRNVRAARVFPSRHNYVFTNAIVGDLLAALETARIPLLIDFETPHWSQPIDWANIEELCTRYPQLPFILVGEGVGTPRRLFPMWQRLPNLYVETSYYQVHQGLSDVVQRFGTDRLLFGSGLPERAPGPPLTQLRYDFLSDEERTAIGGDNLQSLLAQAHNGSGSTLETISVAGSREYSTGSTVTDLPQHPILDAHAHLGPWFSTYINAGDAAGLVRNMDRLGIQATAIIAFDAIGPDMRGGNDQVAAAMREYPGRFLGYATVDPNEPHAMSGELKRCFDELGFNAIKFHCDTHGYPANSENYAPALEYADAHGLAVLIHGEITEQMLLSYPNAQFLSAHVGAWNCRSSNGPVELAKDYPNIHMELCASTVFNGALERLVEEVGADRVVHGSDTPFLDAGYQLGRVLAAKIGPEEKEKILYRNAARLFRLKNIEANLSQDHSHNGSLLAHPH